MGYEFEKLYNFRDLGGLVGAGGRKVRKHRLLRSGNLAELTAHDVEVLQNVYQLRNIADLRTKAETEQDPDVAVPGACYHALDFFPAGDDAQATGSSNQLQSVRNKEEMQTMMKGLYASFITDAGVRACIREVLQMLLDTPEGATLWHCFAGKDRVGITAAVILTILGVSKEDIFADYEKTNTMREAANKEVLAKMKAQGMDNNMLEAIKAALCVDVDYLQISYDMAEKEYGSFENYIIRGIDFDEEQWQKLRKMYLE